MDCALTWGKSHQSQLPGGLIAIYGGGLMNNQLGIQEAQWSKTQTFNCDILFPIRLLTFVTCQPPFCLAAFPVLSNELIKAKSFKNPIAILKTVTK